MILLVLLRPHATGKTLKNIAIVQSFFWSLRSAPKYNDSTVCVYVVAPNDVAVVVPPYDSVSYSVPRKLQAGGTAHQNSKRYERR